MSNVASTSMFSKVKEVREKGQMIIVKPTAQSTLSGASVFAANMDEACRRLPADTRYYPVDGKEAYHCTQSIEDRCYIFSMILDGGWTTHIIEPDIRLLSRENSHEFHKLSDNRICTPCSTLEEAYAAFVVWAACYNELMRIYANDVTAAVANKHDTSNPFRILDKR